MGPISLANGALRHVASLEDSAFELCLLDTAAEAAENVQHPVLFAIRVHSPAADSVRIYRGQL